MNELLDEEQYVMRIALINYRIELETQLNDFCKALDDKNINYTDKAKDFIDLTVKNLKITKRLLNDLTYCD